MARVKPFRAFRYSYGGIDITPLTAPPYDVVDPDLRATLLARDEHNIVALELPEGSLDPAAPHNRYETGARRWCEWRRTGVLSRDAADTVYVLEQRWGHRGEEVSRRAFVVAVGLEPFDAGIILPHERTLPKALDDRLNLTRACAANLSQVLGLYGDPDLETNALFDEAMAAPPIMKATDDDGVVSRVWAITDPEVQGWLASFFADRRIFIADGHHRYTTALAYRNERRAAANAEGRSEVDPEYDYVMMAIANIDDPDLIVLPTHRVVDADRDFDPKLFWERFGRYFDVRDLPVADEAALMEASEEPTFLIRTRADDNPRLAILKPDVDPDSEIGVDASSAWKHLDVAVLQELVLLPEFGIHPDLPASLDRVTFVKDAPSALAMAGEHDVAFVLRPTRVDQLQSVALAGETMPQKSTYFYPKLLSGLLVRSLA